MLTLFQIYNSTIILSVFNLHIILTLMTEVFSTFLIIFMKFMLFILYLLATSYDFMLFSRSSCPSFFKDHFLAVDIFNRFYFLAAVIHFGKFIHLFFLHKVFYKLLGERKLSRILIILLL